MKITVWFVFAALCVAACNRPAEHFAGSGGHGRYSGVGIYPAGRMWPQMTMANAPKDVASSKLADDEQIIVVVDSATGELRQCGNMTGYCVAVSPWAKPLSGPQATPIPLAKHADQLSSEAEAKTKDAAAH